MDEKLQNYLESLKKYTIEMICHLQNDNIDDFEVVLEKRTQIMKEMSELNFDKIQFKKIYEELDIINIDNELIRVVSEKRDETKEKIIELKKSQSANNAYHTNLTGSNIFSKKV